ncbi:hypothetical protein DFJ63DRAFT_336987 [Scheffersomyces coipomensis]|uniref:uncharacterized protein n=1 Tax=Scheffersomyces coipomensis TaxID=1788519 RepID=UPI00315D2D81
MILYSLGCLIDLEVGIFYKDEAVFEDIYHYAKISKKYENINEATESISNLQETLKLAKFNSGSSSEIAEAIVATITVLAIFIITFTMSDSSEYKRNQANWNQESFKRLQDISRDINELSIRFSQFQQTYIREMEELRDIQPSIAPVLLLLIFYGFVYYMRNIADLE